MQPYTFAESTYVVGQVPLIIEFTGLALNDCPFSLSIMDVSDPDTGAVALNSDIFTL